MTARRAWIAIVATICVASISVAGLARGGEQSQRSVSLVALIANPDFAIDSTVSVTGFLARGTNLYLYLSEGNAKLRDIESAIAVDSDALHALDRSGCLEAYVTVVGHYGRDAGGDPAILRLDEVWLPSKDWGKRQCWARLER